MKIGVQTAPILDRWGIEEGFRMISEAGFDCVDFNIDHALPGGAIARGERTEFCEKTDEEMIEFIRPYKEAAAKYGVSFNQMHAPFPFYVKNEFGNEYVMRAVRKCIMIAGYLDCPYVIVHPAFLGYDDQLSPEDEWKINIERYSALIEDCKKYHVTVCLENMFTGHNGRVVQAICSDMAEAARYIDALNEIAGEKCFAFCLDIGHLALLGRNIYTSICQIGKHIETLHIHDNNGMSDQHLFPYMGIIDWNAFCRGLKEVGYKGALSFETFNALNVFDRELHADALKLLGATAHMFARRIEA